MRLIDADEFKKQIAGMAIVSGYPADKANKMCELIDCQPNAYDVEGVVKQVNEVGEKYCNSVKCNENCDDCEHGCLMRAIVKVIETEKKE